SPVAHSASRSDLRFSPDANRDCSARSAGNITMISPHRYSFCIPFQKKIMAKYSKKAGRKVERAMRERKQGKLRSGSGKKVKSRKQAIAIGLSEARKEGAKVPKKSSSKKT